MYAKRLAIAGLLAVLVFGAVYGFANSLEIDGVNKLGSGSAQVESPPAVEGVVWLLCEDDYTMVDKVVIYLAEEMESARAYVELTDSEGTVISRGDEWFGGAAEVTVNVEDVLAADVCDIHITIVGEPIY